MKQIEEMTGSIAIEFGNQTYVKALDNGLFTLGAPHDEGKSLSCIITFRKFGTVMFYKL